MIRPAGKPAARIGLQRGGAVLDGELRAFAGGAEERDAVAAGCHERPAMRHEQAAQSGRKSRADGRGDRGDEAAGRGRQATQSGRAV